MKSKFRELWLKGEKWIEARLKQDVGMLQEAQIIDIQGLGWARVYNVCNVRSVEDLQVLLSPQMTGLGVDSVEELCKGCNIDRKLIVIATVYPEVYPSDMPPLLAHLEPKYQMSKVPNTLMIIFQRQVTQ